MDKQLTISIKTILLAALLGLGVYVLYRLGPIIGVVVVALLLVVSLEPLVTRFTRFTVLNKPIPRSVAVILSYLFLVLFLVFVFTLVIPPVLSQIQKLLGGLSDIALKLHISGLVDLSIMDLLPKPADIPGKFLSVTFSVFSNVITVVSIFIISIYMSLDWLNIKKRVLGLLPDDYRDEVKDAMAEIESNIGNWVKGELTLMLVVGFFCYLGLLIMGVDYALALGLVSGVLEIVPMVGPLLSAVLAAVIGFSSAPIKGVGVIFLYILVQQLENNLLVPKIMQKVSGFSPLIILLALLIGSEFFGVVGAALAVPIMIIGTIILKHFLHYSK